MGLLFSFSLLVRFEFVCDFECFLRIASDCTWVLRADRRSRESKHVIIASIVHQPVPLGFVLANWSTKLRHHRLRVAFAHSPLINSFPLHLSYRCRTSFFFFARPSTMHPDLAPHLHPQCMDIIAKFEECHKEVRHRNRRVQVHSNHFGADLVDEGDAPAF
jgi:hypothetical protein